MVNALIIALFVAVSVAVAATSLAFERDRELGYCVQLLDPNVTVVPVE